MSLSGSCGCRNIEVVWHTIDYSPVPRACQCAYCSSKSAAYVSKPGTGFDVTVRNRELHRRVQQGSNSAVFHECANCDQLVFVSAEINGELYGALNANCLSNKFGFSPTVGANYNSQSAGERLARWQQNWCCPVVVTGLGSGQVPPPKSGK